MSALPMAVPTAADKVDLQGGWDAFWGAITTGFPGITTLMTVVGVCLVVFALIKWAWDRRRGGGMGQGSQPLWGALVPGAILAAPAVLFPLLLSILDFVANIAIKLAQTATSGH
ncbi:hypothetical protein GCM10023063_17180 [Arthrobacter methylotrophus]|uniref:Uncharacterized protein n=1 Tax=Arthrobacter methylotrophus TaxID=121291 RepID=A0ABV5URC8_9MICC